MRNDKFIGVFDNVLTSEEHKKLHDHLSNCGWHIFKSPNNNEFRFSTTLYNNLMDIPEEYDIFAQNHKSVQILYEKITDILRPHIGNYEAKSIFIDCKPYGMNSFLHTDGGEYTLIYYANLDWDSQWEGGTSIYDKDKTDRLDCVKYISYKPNRLIVFPSKMLHRGMPVDRSCFAPRFVVVVRGVVNAK